MMSTLQKARDALRGPTIAGASSVSVLRESATIIVAVVVLPAAIVLLGVSLGCQP